MGKIGIIVIVLLLVGAAGYFYMNANKPMTPSGNGIYQNNLSTDSPAMDNMMTQTIQLAEQNDSSESGTAVLTEKDGKVTVSLNMTGAPAGTPQPAHIHVGSCPDVGAVSYPLTSLVDGKSETVLNVTLADLAAKQPLGINVHKSAAEVKVYVACGNLNLPMSSAAPTSASGSSMTNYGQ